MAVAATRDRPVHFVALGIVLVTPVAEAGAAVDRGRSVQREGARG